MPPLLFLFRPYRNTIDRDSSILVDSKLWFSTPKELNDPFEASPRIVWSQDGLVSRKQFMKVMRNQMPGSTRNERRVATKNHAKENSDPNERAKYRAALEMALLAKFSEASIGCFSETFTDIRMWSYYATGHKGYCLGFSFEQPWVATTPEGERFNIAPSKVHYSPDYPIVDGDSDFEDAGVGLSKNALLTKAREWKHEKEWRMFRPGVPDGQQSYPPSELRQVYLGGGMPVERQQETLEMLAKRNHPVEVYKATISQKKFELEFERLAL